VKTFFDSLALAKRYVDEQGSQAVDDLCMDASELALGVICVPEIISACVSILESNPIRAMDALHVVCALEWKAQLFVSSDKRQISAAKRAGLHKKHV